MSADLPSCATSIDYKVNPKHNDYSVLVWGDTAGCVYLLYFFRNPNNSLFAARNYIHNELPLSMLMNEQIPFIAVKKLQFNFTAWVQSAKLFKALKTSAQDTYLYL